MGIGSLMLEGKDEAEESYITFNDTHGGLTVFVHQCYESLGIDLKVSEAIELKRYLSRYINQYKSLLEDDE